MPRPNAIKSTMKPLLGATNTYTHQQMRSLSGDPLGENCIPYLQLQIHSSTLRHSLFTTSSLSPPVPLGLLQVVANCTYQPRKTAARFGVDPTQISSWLPPMVLPQSASQLESAHSLSGRQPKSLGVMMVLCSLARAHSPVYQHRSSTRRE